MEGPGAEGRALSYALYPLLGWMYNDGTCSRTVRHEAELIVRHQAELSNSGGSCIKHVSLHSFVLSMWRYMNEKLHCLINIVWVFKPV